MAEKTVTIKDKQNGTVLAQGSEPSQVFSFEGNWYFDPAAVSKELLSVTTKTYTCSYKGTCYWVDLNNNGTTAPNIAWVYETPKPGYEKIAGRFAFYDGNRSATVAEVK